MNDLPLPPCDDRRIWDVFLSANHYPTLIAAVEIGFFEELAHGPKTLQELQDALHLNRRPIEVLASLMSALGFISSDGETWRNSDIASTYLIRESRYFWGGMFSHDRDLAITGGGVADALKRDEPTTPHGGSMWSSNSRRPGQAASFTAAMHSHTFAAAVRAATVIDLCDVRRLLDVGGGSGCFAAAVASKFQHLSVTVAELPEVAAITKEYLQALGVKDRVDVINFDMFAPDWPTGFDAILLSNILHDWNDEQCSAILKNAYSMLPAGGTLYVFEMLLNDLRTGPLSASSFSVTMLRLTHGRQRSSHELLSLCISVGFSSFSIEASSGYYSLCKAIK